MATDPKIDIRINTTADTSGARDAERVIDDVKTSTDASTQSTVEATAAEREKAQAIEARARIEAEAAEARRRQAEEEAATRRAAAADPNAEVTGFGGQLEAMERIAQAKREQAEATRRQATETSNLREEEIRRAREVKSAEAELESQRKADVEEARRRRDERAEGGDAPEEASGGNLLTRRAQLAVITAGGVAARTAMQSVSAAVKELIELAPDAARELEGTIAVAKTFDVITNPFEALKSGLESLAGLDDLRASIERANEMQAALDAMIESRRQLTQEAQRRAFSMALQNERIEIDNATAALERQLSVLRARRELMSAEASLEESRRLAAGEDPNLVAADRAVREIGKQVESLGDGITQAQGDLEKARAEYAVASRVLTDAEEEFGRGSQQANAAFEKWDAAGNALAQAVENLGNAEELARIAAARIGAEGVQNIESTAAASGASITAALERAKADLEATAEAQGGQMSTLAAAAYKDLVDILRDGVPDQEQLREIGRVMQLSNASRDGISSEILSQLSAALAADQAIAARLAEIESWRKAVNADLARSPRPR